MPMIAPPTFSSFGDIVAAVQLIVAIIKVLSNTTDAPRRYQALLADLRTTGNLLKSLDRATQNRTVSSDDARSIKAELESCRQLLVDFYALVNKYTTSLGDGGSGNWIRRLQWTLLRQKDINAFKLKLQKHQRTISMFALSMLCSNSNRAVEESRQQAVALANIDNVLQDFLGRVDSGALRTVISAELGHTFDGALGRLVSGNQRRLPEDLTLVLKSRERYSDVLSLRTDDASAFLTALQKALYDPSTLVFDIRSRAIYTQ
ncbi:hypothetical protein NEOLEDRAFT_175408 [Neolentinus lepideus HHB14362 ss-1]|uniref:Uncharacterized protein n=1 Tax=Neolentinus lepideus HHB14362 ss-1 TaxID=1314782 RepID=A0A165MH53_9AGAM|nr:hypothetical protein NEOLEDRAFT_175408 [Neolentinus lepideus HHB14362 ss-1]